jgi:archaellum component FlaC
MDADLKKTLEKIWEKLIELESKVETISNDIEEIRSDLPSSLDSDIQEIKSLVIQTFE